MGKIRTIWADYRQTVPPATKRAATMAARKHDQGCACHSVDLVKCPDYRPQVWDSFRRLAQAPKWAV
jgi:hypothetical protein